MASRRRVACCVGEYRLTKDADDDLLAMFLYGFEMFGLAGAQDYRDGMIRCFALLADNPRLGRRADQFATGARRHEHARHIVFYQEQPDGVLIIGIIHERSVRRLGDV
jgi:toxin ParE1/3/4